MRRREVVGVQKETHTTAGLVAHGLFLVRRVRAGQKKAQPRGPIGGDAHPPLSVAQGSVLEQRKAQQLGKVLNGLVIVAHDERYGY
jgi:hypothetical protein